jgi:hypothetical protein
MGERKGGLFCRMSRVASERGKVNEKTRWSSCLRLAHRDNDRLVKGGMWPAYYLGQKEQVHRRIRKRIDGFPSDDLSLVLRAFFFLGAVLLHFVIEPSMVITEFLAQFIDDCLDLAKC